MINAITCIMLESLSTSDYDDMDNGFIYQQYYKPQ